MDLSKLGRQPSEEGKTVDGKESISSAEGQQEHLEQEARILEQRALQTDSKAPAQAPADPEGKKEAAAEVDSERRHQAQDADEAPQPDDSVTYTSHPIDNFRIGRDWQFSKGVLKLSPEKAEKFDKVLEDQPASIRGRIRKIDAAAADKLARQFISSRRTQGVDTSANGPQSPEPSET